MTTDRGVPEALLRFVFVLSLIAPSAIASCAGADSNRRGDTLDVSAYPPEIQRAYDVFAVRCSRCHTLTRPLNARIEDEQHWIRYVDRMRRNPASGINAKNGQVILRFLLYYTKHRGASGTAEGSAVDTSPDTSSTAASPLPSTLPSELKP